MTIMWTFMILAVVAVCRAEIGGGAARLECAYSPLSEDDDGGESETIGTVLEDGRRIRCEPGLSYCFSIWHQPDDGGPQRVAFSACIGSQSSDDRCAQDSCVAHEPESHQSPNTTYYCCCRTHLCNANMTYVPLPPTTPMPPEQLIHTGGDDRMLLLVLPVTVGCCALLALVAVGALLYRRYVKLPPPGDSTPSDAAHPLFTPTVDLAELKLGEVIGRGRYGSVHKGVLYGNDVAVKVFPAWYRNYFMSEREIYSLPWMDHPSLPKYYGSDESNADGGPEYLIVMSYIPLGTVQDYLRENTVTFDQLYRMSYTAVAGLAHLHAAIDKSGVVKPAVAHRDINSRNILVRADGSCCLCDLGFSMKISGGRFFSNGEEQDAETVSLTDVGTLRYMAPEVLEGAVNLRECETALKQVDMYAVALVLWEMATRCSDLYPDDQQLPEYQLPFQTEIGSHPTFEQMQVLVARNRCRPLFPEAWSALKGLAVRHLRDTIDDTWDQDGEARLTALCVQERLSELPILWQRYKGSSALDGVVHAINQVSSPADSDRAMKPDVNINAADAMLQHQDHSENTTDTLITLSPEQEMNVRNLQLSVAAASPRPASNPSLQRNILSGAADGAAVEQQPLLAASSVEDAGWLQRLRQTKPLNAPPPATAGDEQERTALLVRPNTLSVTAAASNQRV